MDLSIIILSYKSKEHLKVLLPSIWESRGISFNTTPSRFDRETPPLGHPDLIGKEGRAAYTAEVIVVDNDSKDGTVEWLQNSQFLFLREIPRRGTISNFQVLQNENKGFAHGNNVGIKKASGRYILLLNPDTRVEKDTFEVMLDFMEKRNDVGMATCKLVKPDGSLDRAARRNFPNPWNSMLRFLHLQKISSRPYNFSDATADQEMEIDSLVGAFCLTRREVIDTIGMLDEAFFMYGEDLDWCWRCKEAGWKVWYYPKTFITHYKGESSKKAPYKMLKVFHDAMWIFYRKHYASRYPALFNGLVWLGIYGRLGLQIALNSMKKTPRVS